MVVCCVLCVCDVLMFAVYNPFIRLYFIHAVPKHLGFI
jgi:hypothetical protein